MASTAAAAPATLPELVLAALRRQQPSGYCPVVIACSGGLDSQVLLHSAAKTWPAGSLLVAHVNHGLQPQADDWLAFCQATATRLGLPFLARRLPALPGRLDGGVEAWARRMRYRQLADMADEVGAEFVLTAHHGNDQLETYHLRRLRGAGPLGLGAMRAWAPMTGAPHRLLLRPFLGVDRELIAAYAAEHRLDWIEDPSNRDTRFGRNRVRRELARTLREDPLTLQRGLAVIDDFQGAADAAARLALQDLEGARMLLFQKSCRTGDVALLQSAWESSLSQAALGRLSQARAGEVMRRWLAQAGCRMPSRAKLAELLRQLVDGASTQAKLHHDGIWLLRYRDRIDAAQDLPADVPVTSFRWSGERLLEVAGQRFRFDRVPSDAAADGLGFDAHWLADADLVMDQARGADRLRIAPGARSRTWKNLSQERGIPPWVRNALPVLRRHGRVIYAAPFGMNRDAGADAPAACDPDAVARVVADEVRPAWSGHQPRPAPVPRRDGVVGAGQQGAPDAVSEPASEGVPGPAPCRIAVQWLPPEHLARWL